MAVKLEVECYAGYKADEKPRRFAFFRAVPADARGRTLEVRDILDQWYGPGYQCFKVRANDGDLYILRHHTSEGDHWTLDSFRSGRDRPRRPSLGGSARGAR